MIKFLKTAGTAFLVVFSISTMSQAEMVIVGTDVTPGGPDAVCFIGGGHVLQGGLIQIQYSCSATLVAPDEILTAAHCVTPLKDDPQMRIRILCGYAPTAATQAQQDFSKSFKESFNPASIDINPKFTLDQATKEGNSTNDFALIHLTKASQLTPIPVLTPVQSIQEFLGASASGLQCEAVGFGLNAQKQPATLLTGQMTSNDLEVNLTFEKPVKGEISASQEVFLTSTQDIQAWVKMDVQKNQLAEQGKDADSTDASIDQFLFLNDRKLIKSSLMPGDSGGPLLCRNGANSPWAVVGVASTIGLAPSFEADANGQVNVRITSDNKLPIEAVNNWVTPDVSEVNHQILSFK